MPHLNPNATFDAFLTSRDFKTQVTPNGTQRTTLIVAGVYILVIAILWYVSLSTLVLFLSMCDFQ